MSLGGFAEFLGVPLSSTVGTSPPQELLPSPQRFPREEQGAFLSWGLLFAPSRIGYHIPMFLGFTIMFLSTVSEYRPPHPAERGQSRAPGSGEGDKDELCALCRVPVPAGAALPCAAGLSSPSLCNV